MFAFYGKSFLRRQVNWNAALSPRIQESLSSDMRRWLGLNLTGNNLLAEEMHEAPEITRSIAALAVANKEL
jgi:hypothetical protein